MESIALVAAAAVGAAAWSLVAGIWGSAHENAPDGSGEVYGGK